MSDLPQRLRDLIRAENECAEPTNVDLLEEAATEVERLQEALRQAYIGLISLAPEEDQGRIAEAMAKNCGGGTLLSPAPRLSDPTTTDSREGT